MVSLNYIITFKGFKDVILGLSAYAVLYTYNVLTIKTKVGGGEVIWIGMYLWSLEAGPIIYKKTKTKTKQNKTKTIGSLLVSKLQILSKIYHKFPVVFHIFKL